MSPTPAEPIEETIEEVINASDFLPESLQFWVVLLVGAVLAAILSFVFSGVARRALKRVGVDEAEVEATRLPFFGLVTSIVAKSALAVFYRDRAWYNPCQFVILIVLVFFLTWFIIKLVRVIETGMMARLEAKFGPGRRLAKVQTQVGLLRRVLIALLCFFAISAVLLTIEEVRALGAGLLASAGVGSVVVGLAVQSTLTNVFAGLQVAFTDSIRVDDTVVVEGERGTVEEVTLSYVVVLLLDGRRMILPCTYFTTTPFENWSRRSTEISGNIVLELKLNAPIAYLRQRSSELLESSDWWDGRSNELLVTDVQNGLQTVTVYLSSRNPGDLWNLRNMVREKLLSELVENYPECLPEPQMRPNSPV